MRPALSGLSGRRGARRIRAGLVALLLAAPWPLAGAAAADVAPAAQAVSPAVAAASAAARVSARDVQIALTDVPDHLDASTDLSLHATVTNASAEALTGVTVEFSIGDRLMTTTGQIRDWFDANDAAPSRTVTVATRTIDRVDPGATATLDVTVAAKRLPTWSFTDDRGVLGLGARLTSAASDTVWLPSTTAWNVTADELRPLDLIAPITGPAEADQFYDADELQRMVSAGGTLSSQLDALDGLDVELAVDPKIVHSIDALGDRATADMRAWLQRLDRFTTTPLLWGDADANALAAAGVTSIDDALLGGDAGADTPLVLGSCDRGLGQAARELLTGDRPIVIATDEVADDSADVQLHRIGDTPVIGANHNLQNAFQTALTDADTTSSISTARITAMATALGLSTQSFSGVTSVLPRSWSEQAQLLGDVLRSLGGTVRLQSGVDILDSVADAPQTTITAERTQGADDELAPLSAVATARSDAELLASISADPQRVRDGYLERIGSLSSQGLEHDDDWASAVQATTDDATTQLAKVAITSTTNVTLVSGSSQIPVAVRNDTSQPVTVQVRVAPSSGRVVTDSPVPLTIDAHTSATAQVPVRAIANGSVTLNISITNDAGDRIGEIVARPMDVQAQWESIGLAIATGAVALLFGFGVFRSVMRAHRERRGRLAGAALPAGTGRGRAPAGERMPPPHADIEPADAAGQGADGRGPGAGEETDR